MIYMPFLYFPEDKTEYIPAVIMLVIFMALAFTVFYFVIKKSKKDEAKFEQEYGNQIQEIEKSTEEKTDKD